MYIAVIISTTTGHIFNQTTSVKEFVQKKQLIEFLSTKKIGQTIRVFEATELDYAVEVNLTPKENLHPLVDSSLNG